MQLYLAHRALQSEQQPVIEDSGVVEAVAVRDERIDQRAQIEKV
ncbi:hypothetical protein [Candidatus Amarobacter glycogenicus]